MIAQLAMAATLLAGPPPAERPDTVAATPQDPWVSPDKAKHFLIAGFVESAAFAGLEAVGAPRKSAFIGAVTLTGAVSIIREIHDRRARNQFSYRDLTWDVAGGIAAFMILRRTERP